MRREAFGLMSFVEPERVEYSGDGFDLLRELGLLVNGWRAADYQSYA